MLNVLCFVGGKYAVVDTEDGVIEWLAKADLINAVKLGLHVEGYLSEDKILKAPCSLPKELCNWADGSNIFNLRHVLQVKVSERNGADEKGTFAISIPVTSSSGKKSTKVMKGSYTKKSDGVIMTFYGCLSISISLAEFEQLL